MQAGFHLQITEGSYNFVMASDAGLSILNRKDLEVRSDLGKSGVVELSRDTRDWAAVRLAHLLDIQAGDWAGAIFIECDAGLEAVVVAQEVRVIENGATGFVAPFNVVGCTDRGRPVFNGVRINGDTAQLVLDRMALAESAIR